MVYPTLSNDLLCRVTKATETFLWLCESLTPNYMKAQLVRNRLPSSIHRMLVEDMFLKPSSQGIIPPALTVIRFCLTGFLRPGRKCLSTAPSFAQIFAFTILSPDYLAAIAGLSPQEIHGCSVGICVEFYRRTANLLKKAKGANSNQEDCFALSENLQTLLYLASDRVVSVCTGRQLEMAVTRSNGHQPYRPSSQEPVHFLKGPERDYEEEPTVQEERTNIDGCTAGEGAFLNELESEMNKEGWAHLRQYAQHWLIHMGKEPGHYTAMVPYSRLKVLCRTIYSHGRKGYWQLPLMLHCEEAHALIEDATDLYQRPA